HGSEASSPQATAKRGKAGAVTASALPPARSVPSPPASAAGDVLDALLARGDPGHHRPQLCTDLLDLVLGALGLELVVASPAALGLLDPLLGEAAVLDLVDDLAHLGLDGVVDDARAVGEAAGHGR